MSIYFCTFIVIYFKFLEFKLMISFLVSMMASASVVALLPYKHCHKYNGIAFASTLTLMEHQK